MYIGQAAKLAGTTPKTIRHYESIGLLHQPARRGKYRVYSEECVDLVRFIKCAQKLGFKLHELQSIMHKYTENSFPWDLVQKEIEKKKKELINNIQSIQKTHDELVAFEKDLMLAKEECHLISPQPDFEKIRSNTQH